MYPAMYFVNSLFLAVPHWWLEDLGTAADRDDAGAHPLFMVGVVRSLNTPH